MSEVVAGCATATRVALATGEACHFRNVGGDHSGAEDAAADRELVEAYRADPPDPVLRCALDVVY